MFVNPYNLSPFGNWPSFSVMRPVGIVASVPMLLNISSPAAILRAVISIIVDSFKTQSVWAMTHVGKKVFKTQPSIADFYSAPSVVRPTRHIWVPASCQHSSPNSVSFRRLVVYVVSMLRGFLINLVSSNLSATARCSTPLLKLTDVCKRLISTVANAFPHHLFSNPNVSGFHCCKSVELHT